MQTHKTISPAQTKKLARLLAKKLLKKKGRLENKALTLALVGDLGSGKTTFIQGFLRGLGIRGPLTSRTFVLIKNYPITQLPNYRRVYHIDCYRIKNPRELIALGLKEILANPENIVLIEWADRIKKVLPKDSIWLKFEHGEKGNQRIMKLIKPPGYLVGALTN